MDILDMTGNEFATKLGYAYFCPENTNGINFSLEYIERIIEVDWGVALLGVGGNYLSKDFLHEYYLKNQLKNEFSTNNAAVDPIVQKLDCKQNMQSFIDEIVKKMDLETWALSFEKLFYVAIHWLRDNFDDSIDDYQYSFETLWDDFYFISVAYESLFFPPSPPYRPTKRQKKKFDKYLYNWVVFNSQKFLEEEKAKIEREDFHRSEWLEDFESILEGWKMRYYEGEVPQLVKDYEGSHKKL